MNKFTSVLAVALTAGIVALAADLFRRAGLAWYAEQYISLLLAAAMPLIFLHVPARGARTSAGRRVPWYDLAAAIASFACALYMTLRYPELSDLVSVRPADGLVVAAILLVLFLEGLRRTTGLALVLVTVTFFLLALVGGSLPGDLAARSIPLDRLTYFAVWDSSAALGLPMKIVAAVVAIYVLFGQVLFKSGGSTFFTDISMALMGRYRGGPAKIAILGSSLFGTISGSTVSNVLTVGVVTIPLMKQSGYRPHVAGAIEAAASTGGQLMPPVMGIAAFLMAEFLQVPYAQVALAALIPAVLFYVALFIQVDLEAARRGLKPLEPSQIPRVGAVMRAGWYFPIPFVVLVYTLFWLNYEPETAGLAATVASLALAMIFPFQGKRIGWRDLFEMLRSSGIAVLELFMIGAAAGIIIGTLTYSGLGFSLTLLLLNISGGNLLGLLLVAAIASIVLGMGMPTVGVYILLATLIAPALVKFGITPMAAHMFIMYYGCLSMITPPVAIGAFAAANLAGADPMRTGFTAMTLGWTVFVLPFLFVFSNTLLLAGNPWLIALDCATAVAGVWLVSAGTMGYAREPLGWGARAYCVLAGLFLMLPAESFALARWLNVAGGAMALALLAIRGRSPNSLLRGRSPNS
ncbi:MAG TPA: TRAP transporter fused permease subunit [Burkholderiales bacterium]|jgi:TRAP transporter 4TM/12TM fusion protein|nr:TRAP transporter fused permease subunit [Burkholderiales bacterium]